MKPDSRFLNQPSSFWADVREISQTVGYTQRAVRGIPARAAEGRKKAVVGRAAAPLRIKIPTAEEIRETYTRLELDSLHMFSETGTATAYGARILEYFEFRSAALEEVRSQLMDKDQAEQAYEDLRNRPGAAYPDNLLPKNKQSDDKKKPAYLTGMVNMLIYSNLPPEYSVNYDPRSLTLVTDAENRPVYTMARRMDGAFPGVVNPIAVWEIKEYYHTTSFGSKISDGVYETMLDGLEIQAMSAAGHRQIRHYLITDAYSTWWEKGRSYLCRLVDIAHMGHVDEVLFGREIFERVPELLQTWTAEATAAGVQKKQGDVEVTEDSEADPD